MYLMLQNHTSLKVTNIDSLLRNIYIVVIVNVNTEIYCCTVPFDKQMHTLLNV